LEILLESFLKGWLGDPWGTPSLELDVVRIAQSMGEEDRGEVDVRKVTISEVIGAVFGETFDPLCSSREIELWIVRDWTANHCEWLS